MMPSRSTTFASLLLSLPLLLMMLALYGLLSPAPPGALAQASEACLPLPPPAGTIINVSSVAEMRSAVNTADSGTTIRVADGTYYFGSEDYLRFEVPGVTLRSASGNRDAVIIDGNYQASELIQIVVSNITIADLTLREAYDHPIHVMSTDGSHTLNTLIYNVNIVDPGQQAIKINPYTQAGALYFPDDGVIACSHIELTDAGRPYIRDSCYTGGIDAHQAQGWVIRDNVIEGFWCPSGLSEHGIHLWRGCRDTLVERNILRDNARGIGFGLATSGDARTYPDAPCPGAGGGYVDHYDGVIRNNFVFASRSQLFSSDYGFDCGICLWQACGAQVLHNTVASTQDPEASSIEWRFEHTDVDVVNNLVTYRLWDRGGTARLAGNLEYQPLSLFVDGSDGDLHLAATATDAIDQGVSVAAGVCDDDVDGDTRPIGAARDVGADEYGLPPPATVTNLRVTQALTSTGLLTVTLGWTAPTGAVTASLRYSGTLITEANWSSASLITDILPGGVETLTAVVPYIGGTQYFAHRSQNIEGDWSGLSNNAAWPLTCIYLPIVIKNG